MTLKVDKTRQAFELFLQPFFRTYSMRKCPPQLCIIIIIFFLMRVSHGGRHCKSNRDCKRRHHRHHNRVCVDGRCEVQRHFAPLLLEDEVERDFAMSEEEEKGPLSAAHHRMAKKQEEGGHRSDFAAAKMRMGGAGENATARERSDKATRSHKEPQRRREEGSQTKVAEGRTLVKLAVLFVRSTTNFPPWVLNDLLNHALFLFPLLSYRSFFLPPQESMCMEEQEEEEERVAANMPPRSGGGVLRRLRDTEVIRTPSPLFTYYKRDSAVFHI